MAMCQFPMGSVLVEGWGGCPGDEHRIWCTLFLQLAQLYVGSPQSYSLCIPAVEELTQSYTTSYHFCKNNCNKNLNLMKVKTNTSEALVYM